MKKSAWIYAFWISSIIEILGAGMGWPLAEWVAKPLIVLTLGGYYHASVAPRSNNLLSALAFCWLGDVLLMFESWNGLFLTLGLAAFLIAHIFLIITYRLHVNPSSEQRVENVQKIRLAFPVILAGSALVIILFPNLGELQWPVVVYATVLTTMVVAAISRMGLTNSKSFWTLFGGAVLFMISDSLLALNKFYHPIPAAGWFVMITYCLAVYLITQGILFHSRMSRAE